MTYKWKDGSHIKADINDAVKVCEKLTAQNRLTAKNLLEESRPQDAPLHGAFDWDDTVAAEKWRTEQAGHIIRCISVVRQENNEKKEPVRVFFPTTSTSNIEQNYRSIMTIANNPDDYSLVLSRAKNELRSFTSKYSGIQQLKMVLTVIDDFLAKEA